MKLIPSVFILAPMLLMTSCASAQPGLQETSTQPAVHQTEMPISAATIDDTVQRAMQTFQVPGMAIGIVKDGALIFAKGYGVREEGKPGRVDTDTLFQIGSNTKAFTATALAILVDEGKLNWNDKVIDLIPEFQMYDPYVTREFTVRDLLTHRSGLGEGAGDLMFFPATDMSRREIIHGLRYLKPTSSFREKYDYDNLLYMVAGQLIPALTGLSWEEFVTDRILTPLQMTGCAARYDLIAETTNVAVPHVVIDTKATAIPVVDMRAIGPAGTINCSINGLSKWIVTQLAGGRMPTGKSLFSEARSAEMWDVTTPMPISPMQSAMYDSHFSGYGLGWALSDAHGYKRVHHTGGVLGTVTWVSLIPELNLGVIVFTNQESAPAMESVGGQILDAYLGVEGRDWVTIAEAMTAAREESWAEVEAHAAKVAETAGPPPLPLSAYAGTYNDPWRGDASVSLKDGSLFLKFSRTDSLEGPLIPYNGNIFIVRWRDRALNADAYVRFEQGFDSQVAGMTMQAVSPATDFSFDFSDLAFTKSD